MERIIERIEVKIPAMKIAKRVAAYARVSGGKDAMLHSLSAQVSYYSSYIQSHNGWEYCGVYSDEAKTGTKDSRSGFQQLLAKCKAGEIDMVITKSVSRFARNTVTLLETVRELKNLGVDVYFEEQNIHTMSADGELMLTILASYAQEESRSASENQKWRIRKAFEQGELMNYRRQFGFRISKGSITPNAETAPVVNEIFDRVLAGESYGAIARDLERRGICGVLGGKWTAHRVSCIICSERYIGDALQQKTFINNHLEKKSVRNCGQLPMYYAEGTHEGIVDREKYKKAGIIYKERKEKYYSGLKPPTITVFSGLIKCPKCGKNYRRVTSNGSCGWNCSTYMTLGKAVCYGKKIPESTLEAVIADILNLREFKPEAVKENILEIMVPEPNHLVFRLKDGSVAERVWADRSRRESWTPEMKERARQQALKRNRGGQ